MHVVVNSGKSSQWLQELEVYYSSVTRCSETGRQAGPAAQGCNQRPDSSCLPALPSVTFVFPVGCHVAATPLGIIPELQAECRGKKPNGAFSRRGFGAAFRRGHFLGYFLLYWSEPPPTPLSQLEEF